MEIRLHSQTVFLHVTGSGPRLQICLHGFGNTGSLFNFIGKKLPKGVRLVAPDLPGFGKSPLEETRKASIQVFSSAFWMDFLKIIVERFPETNEIIIVGYSMGARVALHWFSNSETPISKLVLIAPDGLRLHSLYRFCVKSSIGRLLFQKTLRNPAPFLFILQTLNKLRFLDRKRFHFINREIRNEVKRELLGRVWLKYAGLGKKIPQIREKTQKWQTAWHLILGEEDWVVLPKWGKAFVSQVPGTQLSLLRGAHGLLVNPSKKIQEIIFNLLE